MLYNELMAKFTPLTKKYQIIPGTVTMDDGSIQTLTFSQLAVLYNVSEADCVLGPITGIDEMRYIKLKPRADGAYDDVNFEVELGKSIDRGPDFDGAKQWTQETDIDSLHNDYDSEEKL